MTIAATDRRTDMLSSKTGRRNRLVLMASAGSCRLHVQQQRPAAAGSQHDRADVTSG
jgi:hypothetical protein